MPFCPKCRAEFREGFKVCNTCKGVALVDHLASAEEREDLQLGEEDLPGSAPIGFAKGGGALIDVDGAKVDPSRIFSLSSAAKIRDVLNDAAIASAIVKLDVELPDNVPRFEVRVRTADQERAEKVLFELWKASAEDEGIEVSDEVGIDECPACGSKVPLDVEECPDCGLVVGTGDERAAPADE